MQVDNSGPSIVFDKKTSQAIEEGKNRVTLLQVEELRLKKLKKSLESDIIKLEAELKSKEEAIKVANEEVNAIYAEMVVCKEELREIEEKSTTLTGEITKREEAAQAQETAVHEKELAVNAKEAEVNALNERITREWGIVEKAKAQADERLKKINDFVKSI